MKPVLLDTCAIIYLFAESKKISESAFSKIEGRSIILSISFAEIACKIKLGRLSLGKHSIESLIIELYETEHFELVNPSPQMWVDTVNLDWNEHKDPVDRMLVSYAIKHDLEIITTDEKMQHIYPRCII